MAEDFKIPSLKVDEIDKKIISVLHEDARISYTDLAKKVELFRVAVQMRINHLVENGVIERFTAVINPAMFRHSLTLRLSLNIWNRSHSN